MRSNMKKATSQKQNKQTNKIIGAAFGDPLANKTFSGYSRHVFMAVQKMGCLAGTISTRRIKLRDFWDGCVNYTPLRDIQRPNISAHWLWRPSTIHKLSLRFHQHLSCYDKSTPVVQIGTHVYPLETGHRFYCVTDMTIAQAVGAGHFKVRHLTNSERKCANNVQKKMFDSCEKIFVLCQWTRSSVITDYAQSPEKVIVIGAGANMPVLPAAAYKYTSHQILFVGLDWQRKGGPLLLDAFRIIKRKISDATLNIIGCKPQISVPGVNLIGPLSRDVDSEKRKLEQLYREANCFCILPEFDPFPNVLLEAQITSTPVVSLGNGSRAEVVNKGISGLLVGNDPEDVAAAIIRILTSPGRAMQMGINGREFVLKNFTWDSVAARLLSHIFP